MSVNETDILCRLSLSEAVLYVQLGGNSNDLPREMRISVAKAFDRVADERCGQQSMAEYRRALRLTKNGAA